MKNSIYFWVAAFLCLNLIALPAQAQGPMLDLSFTMTTAVGHRQAIYPSFVDMVRQPDGKLIVAGDFREINGRVALRVARLLPDGQVDSAFNVPVIDSLVNCVALQADGKVLLGGSFTTVGGQSRIGIARLLSDGSLDPSFLSPLGRSPSFGSYFYSYVNEVVVQPGKGIMVLGVMLPPNPAPRSSFYAARLLETNGALDPTFLPGFDTFDTHDVLVLPNGNLVFAGRPHTFGGQQCSVWSTFPDGALDPAFVPLPSLVSSWAVTIAYGLARDPATGNLYVIQGPTNVGIAYEPVRLLPNGVPDPSFSVAGVFPTALVSGLQSVAVQPNGRLLLGGDIPFGPNTYVGSARLLPSGALDPSYDPNNGPAVGSVRKVLIQPDGALLFCGHFSQAGGFALNCLARMLDPNVLSARVPAQADDDVVAWPVPAHDVLHLGLSATRPAREVTLLDALGRVVWRRTVPTGQLTPALPTAGLAPGAYLLRVSFAEGKPAYRRVAVE